MAKSKAFKWIKRIFIGLGIFLIVFIIAAITLPILFKKQILEAVKSAANEQLNATVDFEDVNLSLIWTFPNFSLSLKKLTVTGKEEFDSLKLADIENISLRLNLWKVIGGDYEVNGVVIDKPKFYVKILNNGKANYDIMKPDTSTTKKKEDSSEAVPFKAKLRYYAINHADIIYDDAPGDMYVKIINLTHTGSGDLTNNNFDFFTRTTIDEITVKMARIAYLNKTKVDIKLNVGVVMESDKTTINLMDNNFKLNALELKADGGIVMKGDDIIFDKLTLSTPNTAFSSVLSMIPAAFTKDFSKVETKGSFSFSANVNGLYNAKSYPAFLVDLKVNDGEFKYPDLPMPVTNINTAISVKSPSSDLDKMTVDVTKFQLKLGNNPFDATLRLKTPISDPDIDTKVNGKIDLAALAKAFPMEGVSSMTGLIDANLQAKTRMSYVEKKQYDKVDMKGLLGISNFIYIAEGMPNITIKNMKMEFTPNNVNLEDFDVVIGKSDIKASGKLDNILTYFSRDKIMMGSLIVRSNLLDIDEMMGSGGETAPTDERAATNMVDTTTAPTNSEVFDRWDFAADFQCKQMKYDVYDIKNMVAKGSFSPSRAKLENFEMLIGKVDLKADGQLDNIFGYLYDNEILKGDLNLFSNYMNLNQFMTEDGAATEPEPQPAPSNPEAVESAYEPILVPANLNFHIKARFNTLIYDTYKLKNTIADLRIRDEKLEIVNLSCYAFGGSLAFNGEYNTKNHTEPTFIFGYDVQRLDFQEVAAGVPMVAYFAPAIKALFGKFSSQFKINGILGDNLYPKLSSLNSEGLLETFDATLRGLTPMKALADQLKLKDIENLVLTNTKNFFKIENGKFILKPFAFKHKDIDMTFGGEHGLDQKMNYDLKMRVPKKLLDKVGVGQAASTGFKALAGEASKLGIKMEEAEFLNIGVGIGGTTTKPTFKPKLLGAEGKSGGSLGDQVKESIKEEANKLKDEAEAKVREEADKLKDEAEARARAEAERAAKELEERARAEADRLTKQAQNSAEAKRIKDSIDAVLKKQKEDLLKKTPPIKIPKNPFGK